MQKSENGWLTLFRAQKNFSSSQNDAVGVNKNDTVKNKKKKRGKKEGETSGKRYRKYVKRCLTEQ